MLFVSSGVYLIAMIMLMIKTGRYIFEIAFSGIFLLFIAPLDISSGQRTKKIIEEIISLFGVIILTMILLRFYGIAMTWTSPMPWFPALILQVAFSIVLIGGPNVIQKILGIDAGVGKELHTMASAMYMANSAGRAVRGGVSMAGKVASGVAKGAAGAGIAGAAGVGAAASGIKNAAAGRKDKPGATPGDYTVLGGSGGGSSDVAGHLPHNEHVALGDGQPGSDTGGGPADPGMPPNSSDSPDTSQGGTSPGGASADAGRDVEGVKSRAAGQAPDAKRVTREDTLGGALGKIAGNTRPAKAAKEYGGKVGTAFNVGKNTMDKRWESYRNQEKPVPQVHGEPVDDPRKAGKGQKPPSPDDIVYDGPDLDARRRGITPGNKPAKGGD